METTTVDEKLGATDAATDVEATMPSNDGATGGGGSSSRRSRASILLAGNLFDREDIAPPSPQAHRDEQRPRKDLAHLTLFEEPPQPTGSQVEEGEEKQQEQQQQQRDPDAEEQMDHHHHHHQQQQPEPEEQEGEPEPEQQKEQQEEQEENLQQEQLPPDTAAAAPASDCSVSLAAESQPVSGGEQQPAEDADADADDAIGDADCDEHPQGGDGSGLQDHAAAATAAADGEEREADGGLAEEATTAFTTSSSAAFDEHTTPSSAPPSTSSSARAKISAADLFSTPLFSDSHGSREGSGAVPSSSMPSKGTASSSTKLRLSAESLFSSSPPSPPPPPKPPQHPAPAIDPPARLPTAGASMRTRDNFGLFASSAYSRQGAHAEAVADALFGGRGEGDDEFASDDEFNSPPGLKSASSSNSSSSSSSSNSNSNSIIRKMAAEAERDRRRRKVIPRFQLPPDFLVVPPTMVQRWHMRQAGGLAEQSYLEPPAGKKGYALASIEMLSPFAVDDGEYSDGEGDDAEDDADDDPLGNEDGENEDEDDESAGRAQQVDDLTVLRNGTRVPLGHRYRVAVTKAASHGGGIGLTIKRLKGWGLVVHAFPRGPQARSTDPSAMGPSERAGIQPGDILVGMDGRLLRPSATADDIAAVVRSSRFPDVILTLDRSSNQKELAEATGTPPTRRHYHQASIDNRYPPAAATNAALRIPAPPPLNELATNLLDHKVLTRPQAQMLTEAIAQLNRRCTQWEKHRVLSELLPPDRTRGKINDSDYLNLYHFGSTSLSGGDMGAGGGAGTGRSFLSTFATQKTTDSGGRVAGGGNGESWRVNKLGHGVDEHGEGIESVPLTQAVFVRMAVPRRVDERATRGRDGEGKGSAKEGGEWETAALQKRHAIRVATKGLRPSLTLRILSVDSKSKDYTEYCIWVLDASSGCEWVIRRRFKEFHQLSERLNALRPALAGIDFPSRTTTLPFSESEATIRERKLKLERYLRRIAALMSYAPLHPEGATIARVFENFLDVPTVKLDTEESGRILELEAAQIAARKAHEEREEARFWSSSQHGGSSASDAADATRDMNAAMAEAAAEISEHLLRSVQVYTTRLLSLPVFERILSEFVGQLESTFGHVPTALTMSVPFSTGSQRIKGTEAADMLQYTRQFVDQLQLCIAEGCGRYLVRMVERRHRRLSKRLCPLKEPVTVIVEDTVPMVVEAMQHKEPAQEQGQQFDSAAADDLFAAGDFSPVVGVGDVTSAGEEVREPPKPTGDSESDDDNPFGDDDEDASEATATAATATTVAATVETAFPVANLQYHASSQFLLGEDCDELTATQPMGQPEAAEKDPAAPLEASPSSPSPPTAGEGADSSAAGFPQFVPGEGEPWYLVPLGAGMSRSDIISDGIRRAIEADVYVPLSRRLREVLTTPMASSCVEDGKQLEVIMSGGVAAKPQIFFGIDVQSETGHESPTGWRDVVTLLRSLANGDDGAGFDSLDAVGDSSSSTTSGASNESGGVLSGVGLIGSVLPSIDGSGSSGSNGSVSRAKEIQREHLRVQLRLEQHRVQRLPPHASASTVVIRHTTLPCDKAAMVMRAAKEIPRLFQREQLQRYRRRNPSNSSAVPPELPILGADDLLPIFIFCLAHSGMSGRQLAELRFVVSSLADPAKRNAELGYYIATFEAALQHLQEMNVADLLHSGPHSMMNSMSHHPRSPTHIGRDFVRGVRNSADRSRISNAAGHVPSPSPPRSYGESSRAPNMHLFFAPNMQHAFASQQMAESRIE